MKISRSSSPLALLVLLQLLLCAIQPVKSSNTRSNDGELNVNKNGNDNDHKYNKNINNSNVMKEKAQQHERNLQENSPLFNIVIPPNDDSVDPLLQMIKEHITDTATTEGMWSFPQPWPTVSIHLTVLPDGRVMSYGAAIDGSYHWGSTFIVWDPTKGFVQDAIIVVANAPYVDSFCADGSLLPDGSYLAAGGGSAEEGGTSHEGSIFDYRTNTVTRAANLNEPRWYGTMTRLPDGRVLETGGGETYTADPFEDPELFREEVSSTPEVYTPGNQTHAASTEGRWDLLPNATSFDAYGGEQNRYWFPRQWVTSRGTVFGISTDKMWELDPNITIGGSIRTIGNFKTPPNDTSRPNVGPTSTAVMYDIGKIIQVGGNGLNERFPSFSSALATLIDITDMDNVTLHDTAPMAFPRQWGSAAVFPNGDVFVVGGTKWGNRAGDDGVLESESWNPTTEQWTTLASAARYRLYHGTLVLLPNGAMLSSGGGVPGPVHNYDSEVFYPPYLFTKDAATNKTVLAPRPRIVSVSNTMLEYGDTMNLEVLPADDIAEISFISLPVSTHSFDANMRRLKLTFSVTASTGVVDVIMPSSPNLATPGYYYVSVLNSQGVPSVAVIVSMRSAPPPPPKVFPVDPGRSWQYTEPLWWQVVSNTTYKGNDLKRCHRRQSPPAVAGMPCAQRLKTCFFGTQFCEDASAYPVMSCSCDGSPGNPGTWACQQEECPDFTFLDFDRDD